MIVSLYGCTSSDKKDTAGMQGVYDMQSVVVNDGTKDTSYANLNQLKIYTDDFMMYGTFNPKTSSAGFGIGSYTFNNGKVVEHVIFSATDSDKVADFTLDITKTPKGYTQIFDIKGTGEKKYKVTEEYSAIGKQVTSPLDGAWQLSKSFKVKGKDTTTSKLTQFKTYYHNHFIWGQYYTDTVTHKTMHTVGYGTFETTTNNKLKETIQNSSFAWMMGKSFEVNFEMNGKDEFTQTIIDTAGVKNMEIFRRLKK